MSSSPLDRVDAAIDDIRRGKMVILIDDEDRENEGDLVLAAEKVTPEAVNFMAKYGRGLICVALTGSQIEKLQLPMMVKDNQAPLETAFTVSVEARHGVTTGISAKDRSTTIRAAISDDAQPEHLVSPGHVFPLKARKGGVLVRSGQTEGSVDLARLAGLKPAGVICEIMRDDGEMARLPELEEFGRQHDIRIVSVADLIAYRLRREMIVSRVGQGSVRPGQLGAGELFEAHYYKTDVEDTEYLALVRGDVRAASEAGKEILVRVHSMSPAGDALSLRPELDASLKAIDDEGLGVFLYVCNPNQTTLERSVFKYIMRKSQGKAVSNIAERSDALRDFGLGAQVLADVGCKKIRLMSNSDRKIVGIEGFGIEVVERVSINTNAAVELRSMHGGKE